MTHEIDIYNVTPPGAPSLRLALSPERARELRAEGLKVRKVGRVVYDLGPVEPHRERAR